MQCPTQRSPGPIKKYRESRKTTRSEVWTDAAKVRSDHFFLSWRSENVPTVSFGCSSETDFVITNWLLGLGPHFQITCHIFTLILQFWVQKADYFEFLRCTRNKQQRSNTCVIQTKLFWNIHQPQPLNHHYVIHLSYQFGPKLSVIIE